MFCQIGSKNVLINVGKKVGKENAGFLRTKKYSKKNLFVTFLTIFFAMSLTKKTMVTGKCQKWKIWFLLKTFYNLFTVRKTQISL